MVRVRERWRQFVFERERENVSEKEKDQVIEDGLKTLCVFVRECGRERKGVLRVFERE